MTDVDDLTAAAEALADAVNDIIDPDYCLGLDEALPGLAAALPHLTVVLERLTIAEIIERLQEIAAERRKS